MKIRAIVIFILIATGVASLSGCSSSKYRPSRPAVSDFSDDRLLQAALDIKKEMGRINQIGTPVSKAPPVADTPSAPHDFKRIATIDYDGDIEGFLGDLKGSGLYEVRIYGRRPATDLPVSLHHYRQPIWRILEDAGIQLGRFATIGIKSGVVIVNYANYNQ